MVITDCPPYNPFRGSRALPPMRDPISWSVPLPFRASGSCQGSHLSSPVVTRACFLGAVDAPAVRPRWWVDMSSCCPSSCLSSACCCRVRATVRGAYAGGEAPTRSYLAAGGRLAFEVQHTVLIFAVRHGRVGQASPLFVEPIPQSSSPAPLALVRRRVPPECNRSPTPHRTEIPILATTSTSHLNSP